MYINYDQNNLKNRQKTVFSCEGKTLYTSIYDFAFKYRTRIFNDRNEEAAYVEKDIYATDKVIFFDGRGNRLDEMHRTAEGYRCSKYLYVGDIDKGEVKDLFANEDGKLTIYDENSILYVLMIVTGLIEIRRKD